MKLSDALKFLKETSSGNGEFFDVFIACGFMPLHISTFLKAQLYIKYPDKRINVKEGIYGDLMGNLARMKNTRINAGVVCLEWSDLDPRLGLRGLGGWSPGILTDIVENVKLQSNRIIKNLENMQNNFPISMILPTLPIPPVSHHAGYSAGGFELDLYGILSGFARKLLDIQNLKIASPQRLNLLSPLHKRLSAKMEILYGFPYRMNHASIMAELISELIVSRPPKKGLITDLDNTLWKGILGEVGIGGVSWDIEKNSHMHALYQQMLQSLSETGIFIGVASKNDPDLVKKAFSQRQTLISTARMFPMEINWKPKSQSVTKILKAWNIGASDVVFIDDSPLELDEVKSSHPQMKCLLFPSNDFDGIYALLEKLRDIFGKESILEEDSIRLDTIKKVKKFENDISREAGSEDEFLSKAGQVLTIHKEKTSPNTRPFELVNKTNQFNLNGIRYTESEWIEAMQNEMSFLIVADYNDRYGPLGKIAVLLGRNENEKLYLDSWVMSCRSFSRRIEYKCLEYLFEYFKVDEIVVNYNFTERNAYLRDFFSRLSGNSTPQSPLKISRKMFLDNCPKLFFRLKEA